jgi:hypothetical protein
MMSQINDKGNRSGTEKTEDQPERRVRVTERDKLLKYMYSTNRPCATSEDREV